MEMVCRSHFATDHSIYNWLSEIKACIPAGLLQNGNHIDGGVEAVVAVVIVSRLDQSAQILDLMVPGVLGQMDGLLDDRTPSLKKFRYIALIAPVTAALLYLPCVLAEMPYSTKISLSFLWIAAIFSSYFNFKHAIISDLGYGFVKAIRPYNICALILTFLELILQILWAYYVNDYILIVIMVVTIIFSIVSVLTMVTLKRGVEAWKI